MFQVREAMLRSLSNWPGVIITTYNRCQSLARTPESFLRMRIPGAHTLTVIVADNNSTDKTRQTLGDYQARFGSRLRYVAASNALNEGLQSCWQSLARTLESLLRMAVPAEHAVIIIVADNNSSDVSASSMTMRRSRSTGQRLPSQPLNPPP